MNKQIKNIKTEVAMGYNSEKIMKNINFKFQEFLGFTNEEFSFMWNSFNGWLITPNDISELVNVEGLLDHFRESYHYGNTNGIDLKILESKVRSLTRKQYVTLIKHILVYSVDFMKLALLTNNPNYVVYSVKDGDIAFQNLD
jgi:hypothetical protein